MIWKFGERVDTDQILPGPYLSLNDSGELAKHIFEKTRAGLAQAVKPGDIIIGGKEFGCGSAREHAVRALIGAGIRCVVAESYARMFFRISIDLGLEILTVDDTSIFDESDDIEVCAAEGKIINKTTGAECCFQPMPEFIQRIISCGGLVAYAKKYLVNLKGKESQTMSKDLKVPCTIMRGGTSKGVFFYENNVPPAGNARDEFLCDIMGSPDVRQIDGLGGADPLTSKVAILSKSESKDADVNYTFAQVSLTAKSVDYKSNCGNITSGVGLFAVQEEMVPLTEPKTVVRIYNTNTKKILKVYVPCKDGQPEMVGNYAIDGVPGAGPRLDLDFSATAGAASGKLLPSGNLIDEFDVPDVGKLQVTIVDIANPVVFIRAKDLGLTGVETPNEMEAMPEMKAKLEAIRGMAAVVIGLTDDWRRSAETSAAMPLLAVVSDPAADSADVTITSRLMFMQTMHKAYSGTAAVCTAVACKLPGTIPYEFARKDQDAFVISHPAGKMDVDIDVSFQNGQPEIKKASFGRTARRLMEGMVFLPVRE